MRQWCVSRGHKANGLEITEPRQEAFMDNQTCPLAPPPGQDIFNTWNIFSTLHVCVFHQRVLTKCGVRLATEAVCKKKIKVISLNITSLQARSNRNMWFYYESIRIMAVQVECATFWSSNDVCILLCLHISSNSWVFRDSDTIIYT